MYYYGGGSSIHSHSCGCANQWFYPSCGVAGAITTTIIMQLF